MRNKILLCLTFLFCSCFFFKSRPVPYPSGVLFPLVKDGEVLYRGRIIDVVQKRANYLYFSTDRGLVYSVNGKQRTIRWFFRTKQESISSPYLGRKSVYVFDDQATLYCIDLNGQLSWKKKIEGKITTGINESQGRIYLGTEEGNLFCLDQNEGEELWRFRAEGAIRSTPVLTGETVIFGCDDRRLYLLGQGKEMIGAYEVGDQIQSELLVDGRSVYFGAKDGFFYCFDLKRKRVRWKVKTGCLVLTSPVADKKRVVFLCWSGILYCLNKRNGNIVWWDAVPSRSFYSLERIEDRVIVTSLSSLLVSYDIQTGEKIGEFESDQLIQSNPVWFEPYVVVNHFDFQAGTGHLLFLKKEVKVELEPSLASPQKTGEEIWLVTKATGFFRANFEFIRYQLLEVDFIPSLFFLSIRWEKEIVQKKSEQNAWQWLPEDPGVYAVAVEVVDEKERAEDMIPYMIEREKPRVSVKASKESPQNPQQEIIFDAKARGLKLPQYIFYLNRLIKADFHPDTLSLSYLWEREVVQEASEVISWTWTPENLGVYMIEVTASDEKEEVEDRIGFLIEKEKPKVTITPSEESPHEIRKKITFEARATGLEKPEYSFYLSRLVKVDFHPAVLRFTTFWEKREVQQESEKNSWEWRPSRPGIYMVTVKATGDETEAESDLGYRVLMRPDRRTINLIFFLIEFVRIFIPIMG